MASNNRALAGKAAGATGLEASTQGSNNEGTGTIVGFLNPTERSIN
jgi:hypothetical protein